MAETFPMIPGTVKAALSTSQLVWEVMPQDG